MMLQNSSKTNLAMWKHYTFNNLLEEIILNKICIALKKDTAINQDTPGFHVHIYLRSCLDQPAEKRENLFAQGIPRLTAIKFSQWYKIIATENSEFVLSFIENRKLIALLEDKFLTELIKNKKISIPSTLTEQQINLILEYSTKKPTDSILKSDIKKFDFNKNKKFPIVAFLLALAFSQQLHELNNTLFPEELECLSMEVWRRTVFRQPLLKLVTKRMLATQSIAFLSKKTLALTLVTKKIIHL